MVSETRYMKNESITVNGLTCYKLATDQSSVSQVRSNTYTYNYTVYWGYRIYLLHANGTKTELTSGVQSHSQRSSNGEGLVSNTWSQALTMMSTTDAIVIEVYQKAPSGGSWALMETFATEQLGYTQLDAATWTIYLYTWRWYVTGEGTTGNFYFGKSTYDSKITNFSYSTVSKQPFGDGLTFAE